MKEKFFYENLDDALCVVSEAETDAMCEIVADFERAPDQRQPWRRLIKRDKLLKLWNNFVSTGVVTDYRGIWDMQTILLHNISRLFINTLLCGHDITNPKQYLLDMLEKTWSEEQWEKFWWHHVHDELSDYGLQPLQSHLLDLLQARTCERKLKIIDRILNVVHQRGDLAALFVEGGSRTLSELAGDNDETNEREYGWSNRLARDSEARLSL
ncbi:MAG: hypothetical protein ACK4S4_15600 [Pyrinomonadaceae bacterium]